MADLVGVVVAAMIVGSMVALAWFALGATVTVALTVRETHRDRELVAELDRELAADLDRTLATILGPRAVAVAPPRSRHPRRA
jgi:cell division protein FtsL